LNGPLGVFVDNLGLWVADSGNNRVLQWNTVPASLDVPADHVYGQTDFVSGSVLPTSSNSLHIPSWVFSDNDFTYVCDSSNNRVLLYSKTTGVSNCPNAFAVLGQADFTSNLVNQGGGVSSATFNNPSFGASNGRYIAISDINNSRVLIFDKSKSPITIGRAADYVIGQPDFVSFQHNQGLSAPQATTLRLPTILQFYNDLLYVVDSNNRRICVYDMRTLAISNTAATTILTIAGNWPMSLLVRGDKLYVSNETERNIWVFNSVPSVSGDYSNPDIKIGNNSYYGLELSPTGELLVADLSDHRVLIYGCSTSSSLIAAGGLAARYSGVRQYAPKPLLPEGKSLIVVPNPIREKGTVVYKVDQPAKVVLSLDDIQGRTVLSQDLGEQIEGEHVASLNHQNLASGVYLLRLMVNDGSGFTVKAVFKTAIVK
jgi:hypothetical protein